MQHGKWYIADIYVFGNDDIFKSNKDPGGPGINSLNHNRALVDGKYIEQRMRLVCDILANPNA